MVVAGSCFMAGFRFGGPEVLVKHLAQNLQVENCQKTEDEEELHLSAPQRTKGYIKINTFWSSSASAQTFDLRRAVHRRTGLDHFSKRVSKYCQGNICPDNRLLPK
ncbi:hypothetical protein ILYODFUR_013617 [Ilyodon furcidens]|uniref:Uncharacterized protein n=1 Tax=Ilyodon furcidens TaxID=33524 RepID=A0ABV0TY24_9TELE